MIKLENSQLVVQINEIGAEITSVIDKATGYEFIWQADPAYWGRHAPALFPIVGGLKNDTYEYQGVQYHLGRHGFARDRVFKTQATTANSASFYLKSDEETLKQYPFEFSFQITYILHQNSVTVSYEVLNPSAKSKLYYSVGGHPAFNVEQNKSGEFDDVTFSFEPEGAYLLIPLTSSGLIDFKKAKYKTVTNLQLTHKDFKRDALVYQINDKTEAVLRDAKSKVEIRLRPSRMNYIGVWSPKGVKAPFICIEPWVGIGDTVDTTGRLEEKYGVVELLPNQIMTHDYTMSFMKDSD